MNSKKPYGDIRHEAKVAQMNKHRDPVEQAKQSIIRSIDEVEEIREAIKELTDSYKYQIGKLKDLIKEYFSDLQSDESRLGAMRRLQIRKELLEFATK